MNQFELTNWHLNGPATEESIRQASLSLRIKLPPDYAEFMKKHNGGEGFIGDNYVILWRVEELAPFNRDYEVEQYAPGLIMFGSKGGGEAYAFDTRKQLELMNSLQISVALRALHCYLLVQQRD